MSHSPQDTEERKEGADKNMDGESFKATLKYRSWGPHILGN
jgi:hypothetical protein